MATPPFSFRFSKAEKLCLRTHTEWLLTQGQSVYKCSSFRLRAAWLPARPASPPKILLSVSKRLFRRAHERNRTKRVLREAYRLHKHALQEIAVPDGYYLALHIVWQGRRLPSWDKTRAGMALALEAVVQQAAALPRLPGLAQLPPAQQEP
ncbi:MAG: ribonuclease P protein component [Bacteroidetes bacterium]|nr:ribonuclease P protein component [Bacteroidota bacterium]